MTGVVEQDVFAEFSVRQQELIGLRNQQCVDYLALLVTCSHSPYAGRDFGQELIGCTIREAPETWSSEEWQRHQAGGSILRKRLTPIKTPILRGNYALHTIRHRRIFIRIRLAA